MVRVNTRGTFSLCPRCGGKLSDSGYRTLKYASCGFVGGRDVVATVNLYKRFTSKYSRCEGLGCPERLRAL